MPQLSDRNPNIPLVLAVMIILAGVAVRFHQIGYNFDGDELFSVSVASGSFRHVLSVAMTDLHPPLYYLLLWAWLKFTSPSEIGARVLSVVASAIFLVIFWRLASRLVRPIPALLALFLCAASPFLMYYGQQARMYALIPLFTTLSLFFFLRAIGEPGSWRWAFLWGTSCVALLYTQYVGVLLLLPQLAASAICPVAQRRRLITIGLFATASILPWVVAVRLSKPLDSKLGAWIGRPGVTGLVEFFVGIFGWGPWHGTTRVLIGLCLVALLSLLLHRGFSAPAHLPLVFALAAFPPVVLFLVSQYGPVSVWAPRQMIGSAVFVLLLIAIALSLHHRLIGAALATVFATWMAIALPAAFPENMKPPWRALGARLAAEAHSSVIGEEDWVVRPLQHYSRADVRYITDYPPGQCCGPQLVFVCRPFRCAELTALRTRYEQAAQETIQWTLDPGPTSTLNLYVLRQRR